MAVVGPSGAGKTTLARLLVRFADPDSGSIGLGPVDLREAAQDAVRRRVRLVGQEAYLFTATIAANVRMGRPDCGDADIVTALARAGLGPWVAGLRDGIGTAVGEEGAAVSGGQRGRIALARGLVSDSDHLILDEPTAQLDPAGARELLAGLGADRSDRRGVLVVSTPNILNFKSRLRFLVFGFWSLFGPLNAEPGRGHECGGHISPISLYYLLHALKETGFGAATVGIDKRQRSSLFLLAPVYPLLRLLSALALRREKRRYRTVDARNEGDVRMINRLDILLGRTIVVGCRKPV